MIAVPTLLKSPTAKLPQRANTFDAGADLYLTEDVTLLQDEVVMVDCEISIALPEGTVGLIFSRSSNAKKHVSLANGVGVIDSGYRGNIKLPLLYTPNIEMPVSTTLSEGERVAQIVVLPVELTQFVEVSTLSPSSDDRGVGGFGSTSQ